MPRRTKTKDNMAILGEEGVLNASPANGFGDVVGHRATWNYETFTKNLFVQVASASGKEIEFDMIGIEAPLANALRRTILSDVPSVAAEKVTMFQNTSIIQDEVLAHRIGLIPLKADPKFFEMRPPPPPGTIAPEVFESSENDSLEFELKVKCTMNPHATKGMSDPDDLYRNHLVKSGDIKWVPIGSQTDLFKEEDVRPADEDILLAKLRPGQEVEFRMVAVKGIGRDHAKFMPGHCWYRLMPHIELKEEIEGERAYRLQECFSPGVIRIEKKSNGRAVAVVENPRYDTCSRNVFTHDDLKDAVELGKIHDHFIFTVESVGGRRPEELVREALKILMSKCSEFLSYL